MEDLSSVEPLVMVGVVNKLEDVILHYSQLSIQQAEAIIAQTCVQTSLKKLVLDSNPKLERRSAVLLLLLLLLLLCTSRSGDPPWILKRAGLESSGRRLISSIGKSKGIAFFFFFSANIFFFQKKVIF